MDPPRPPAISTPGREAPALLTPSGLRSLTVYDFGLPPDEALRAVRRRHHNVHLKLCGLAFLHDGYTCACGGGRCPVAEKLERRRPSGRMYRLALEAAVFWRLCEGVVRAATDGFLAARGSPHWDQEAVVLLARIAARGTARGAGLLDSFRRILAAGDDPNARPDLVARFPGAPGAPGPCEQRVPLLAYALRSGDAGTLGALLARPDLSLAFRLQSGGAWLRADEVPFWADADRALLQRELAARRAAFEARAEAALAGGEPPAGGLGGLLAEAARQALVVPPDDLAAGRRLAVLAGRLLAGGADPEPALACALDGGPVGPATRAVLRGLKPGEAGR